MFDTSLGDIIAKYAPLVGWATLIGLVWRFRGIIDDQLLVWKGIDSQTKEALTTVANVKEKVDVLQNTHLRNIQTGLETLGNSNEKAVEVLQDIKNGIGILVDRGTRDLVVETKIRHVDPISPVKPIDDKEI
jgi:hypothetical protein